MKPIYSILFLLLGTNTYGQFLTQYHPEEEPEVATLSTKSIMNDGFIYYTGTSLEQQEKILFIRKLDTNGQLIWTASDYVSSLNGPTQVNDLHFSNDGYLYAHVEKEGDEKIWKVDLSTGELIFDTPIVDSIGHLARNISTMYDLSEETLFFSYAYGNFFSDYDLVMAKVDRNTGMILDSTVYQHRPDIERHYIAVDPDQNIYYTLNDSIFKSNINDLSSILWSQKIPSTGNTFLNHLEYNLEDNAIYGFGTKDNVTGDATAFRMNVATGETDWVFDAESTQNVLFSDLQLDEDYLYVTWRHSTFGGINTTTLSQKINRHTGIPLWESDATFANNQSHQAALDLVLDDNKDVLLTGYFNSSNYAPGDWGIMKLDGQTGDKICANLITNYGYSYDLSMGIGIFPLPDKTIVIGQKAFVEYEAVEVYFEMDNNCETITEKYISTGHQFESATIGIDQFLDGTIIVGQQMGRYAKVILQDEWGVVNWDTTLLMRDYGFEFTSMDIINDSIVALSGRSHNYPESFNGSAYSFEDLLIAVNRKSKTVEFFNEWSVNNQQLRIVDAINGFIEPNTTSILAADLNINNSGYKIYRIKNSSTSSIPISIPTSNINQNNKVLVDHQDDLFLALSNGGLTEINKSDLNIQNSFVYPGVAHFNHIDQHYFNNYLACGKSTTDSVVLTFINQFTLDADFVDVLPIQGSGLTWAPGESDWFTYILSTNNNDILHVSKYNVGTQELIWSEPVIIGNGEKVTGTDIAYNRASRMITITGHSFDVSAGESKVLLAMLETDGRITANIRKKGDAIKNNRGLTLHAHRSSYNTLIGGVFSHESDIPSAFIYYLDGLELNNIIKGSIFLDSNEDGVKDLDEEGINIGTFLVNDEYVSFPNDQGCFSTLVSPGIHNIMYQLPDDWELTTDSISYTIQTTQQTYGEDILLFGLKPTNNIEKVEPFIFPNPLVCNQTSTNFLKVKNTGTVFSKGQIQLVYPGVFQSSNIQPDTIQNDTLFWSFEDLAPGNSILYELELTMPGVNSIGDSLIFHASSFLLDNNQIITDSFKSDYRDILLCAYDPNDKKVSPAGIGEDGLTNPDQFFTYTVRFQNTGNYPARDIIITDTLDQNLDWESFEFLIASHPITEVNRRDHAVEFIFNNINLPDSLNNEPESHGLISFRIKPKENLANFTDIFNTAHIYFDQNPAIVTNTVKNKIDLGLVDLTIHSPLLKVQIFPNPSSGMINVLLNQDINKTLTWQLWSPLGQRIQTGKINSRSQQLNMTKLSPGIYILDIEGVAKKKLFIEK